MVSCPPDTQKKYPEERHCGDLVKNIQPRNVQSNRKQDTQKAQTFSTPFGKSNAFQSHLVAGCKSRETAHCERSGYLR